MSGARRFFLHPFGRDPQFTEMLELLAMLKKGHCDGLKVRTGRLQNLISSSCIGITYHFVMCVLLIVEDYYKRNVCNLT